VCPALNDAVAGDQQCLCVSGSAANQVPLINKHLERYWKISHMNDSQADTMVISEGTHGQE